jgi:hypothetical protein
MNRFQNLLSNSSCAAKSWIELSDDKRAAMRRAALGFGEVGRCRLNLSNPR